MDIIDLSLQAFAEIADINNAVYLNTVEWVTSFDFVQNIETGDSVEFTEMFTVKNGELYSCRVQSSELSSYALDSSKAQGAYEQCLVAVYE